MRFRVICTARITITLLYMHMRFTENIHENVFSLTFSVENISAALLNVEQK